MTEKKPPLKEEKAVYGLGDWSRVDEDKNWCDICNKSTLWWAPTFIISINGVTTWGKVEGCKNGKNWAWYDRDGNKTREKAHEKVGMQ